MGMIMHDDVPYGEGTSYTQGTGIAINNNVIAVDADNTPTENSEKPVKSKGVYEEIEQIYADNGVLGAKNFLCDYAPTTITSNGITWTRDENGVITANGTTTGASYYELWSQNPKVSEGYKNLLDLSQTYILNGNSQVWSDEWYVSLFMRVHLTDNSDRYFFDNGNGVVINLSQFNNIGYITMYCRVGYVQHGAQTVSNYKIRPMLRLASDPDDTYVPYAMTNKELTEKVDEFTASQAPVNGVVTFPDLNPDYGYKLYVDIPDETSSLPTNLTDLPVCKWTKVQRSTKADGTITLAYTVTNINVNYCLRILK